jgi:hypothetical protein
LVPALAIKEEREKFEGTQTGFSFDRQTTVLSTLNTIHLHIEPDESHEEPFKSPIREEFVECRVL